MKQDPTIVMAEGRGAMVGVDEPRLGRGGPGRSGRKQGEMKWIGLTGGIATGKSSVTRLLRARGIPVVCADELARDVVAKGSPGLNEVVARFGPGVVGPDGELDRKSLGRLVFADPAKRAELEAIIHPRVRDLAQQKRRALAAQGHALGFYDVPLLFEKSMRDLFDVVVVVACRPETQKKRLMARDRLAESDADARIAAQLPIASKAAAADHVVNNDGSPADLERAVERLLKDLGA